MSVSTPPTHDVDLFSDEVMTHPYDAYRQLRAAGPAVRLTRHDTWALARYEQVRRALYDHDTFSSASGVGYEPELNKYFVGTVIASDPPEHERLRAILSEQMAPEAMRRLEPEIVRMAGDLVDPLMERDGPFDAITELAKVFPVSLVSDLVGLPADARDKILEYTDASFNVFGPFNELAARSLSLFQEAFEYMDTVMTLERLHPDGWAAQAYAAADRGEISHEQVLPTLMAYLFAGMDTTINGIGSSILMLARRPRAWRALREQPSLIPGAFEEALRLESPVQALFRVTTRDVDMDGVTIPAGERVLLLFGSANRDERQWQRPDDFDVTRNPAEHLGFGHGIHSCAGQSLARIAGQAVLRALSARAQRLDLTGPPGRRVNNVVRGLTSLPVKTR